MIEYYLHTGIQNDSDNYYINGKISQQIGSIQNDDTFTNHISINGKTLLEDTFVETKVNQEFSVIKHSGDFYLKDYTLNNSGGYYDFSGTNLLLFDKMQSGKRTFYESDNFNTLVTKLADGGPVSGELIFVNGIKLISGIHYYIHNNIFEWDDGNLGDLNIGGIIFSMPNSAELIITGVYDIYNQFFLKGTSLAYLNGVKLNKDEFLETCTMVDLIKTGIEPEIEFSQQSIETIISF
jgi:hypothetical protein